MSALMVDWLAAYFIVVASTGGLFVQSPGREFKIAMLFLVHVTLPLSLQGASLGHRIFGIRVIRFSDGGRVFPLQALLRTALVTSVIFAITFDENGRGLHERLSGTVLTRTRS
jgi:uncharacterized RDD family membrane protein YckC